MKINKIKILLLIAFSFFYSNSLKAQSLYVGANYHPHDDKNIEKIKELQVINFELQSLYSQYEQLNKSKFKQIFNKDKIKKIQFSFIFELTFQIL